MVFGEWIYDGQWIETVQTDQNGAVDMKWDKHDAHVIHLTLDSRIENDFEHSHSCSHTFPNANNGFIRLIDFSRVNWIF